MSGLGALHPQMLGPTATCAILGEGKQAPFTLSHVYVQLELGILGGAKLKSTAKTGRASCILLLIPAAEELSFP